MDALREVVLAELAAAGLPASSENGVGTAGAVVQLDLPELRGVLVDWREHDILIDASQEAWGEDPNRQGEECAAFSRLLSEIGEAMAEAMRKILTAAGLEVRRTENDYGPHELLVTRRVEPSVWRARRDATFTRRYESMQEAWRKRHAEECPKVDCEVHRKGIHSEM